MINFKVCKAPGWNKYIIKQRCCWIFWRHVKPKKTYVSKAAALMDCYVLMGAEK